MAFKPAGSGSSGWGGVINPSYLPGQSPFNAAADPVRGNPCICGSPATKWFGNPRGVSVDIAVPLGQQALVLCGACDFRWTVMRAAGRSEEFITDYEEKHRVRVEEEAERARKYRAEQQAHYQMKMQKAQMRGQGQICPENVQTPEEKKSMWDAVREYVRRKNA